MAMLSDGTRLRSWNELSRDEKIASLESTKRDVLAQMRRSVHTARSNGEAKYLAKIDKQLRALMASQ